METRIKDAVGVGESRMKDAIAMGKDAIAVGESRMKDAVGAGEARIKDAVNAGLSDNPLQQREGPVARKIEAVTSKLPSDVFLWASVGSMAVSALLQLSGDKRTKHVSNFIGQWAPTLLILGLYNKLVKVAGHDRLD